MLCLINSLSKVCRSKESADSLSWRLVFLCFEIFEWELTYLRHSLGVSPQRICICFCWVLGETIKLASLSFLVYCFSDHPASGNSSCKSISCLEVINSPRRFIFAFPHSSNGQDRNFSLEELAFFPSSLWPRECSWGVPVPWWGEPLLIILPSLGRSRVLLSVALEVIKTQASLRWKSAWVFSLSLGFQISLGA